MKKVLSIVLSIAMVLCMMPAMAFAGTTSVAKADAAYSDTEGLACEGAVNVLSALGVVDGYTDGTYKPEQVVTRAEMAKLIVTALGVDKYATATTSKFTDMGAASWAIPYVEYASNLNIVNGYGYGLFGPNDTVTYEQAVTMIVRALGYTDDCNEMNGSWPAIYVQKATALGLFENVVNGGAAGADRGDVAIMLYNALDVIEVYADQEGKTNYKFGSDGQGVTMMDTLNKNGESYYAVITPSMVETSLTDISGYLGAVGKVTTKDGDVLALGDIKSTTLTGNVSNDKKTFTVNGVDYSLENVHVDSAFSKATGVPTNSNTTPGAVTVIENGVLNTSTSPKAIDVLGAGEKTVTIAANVSGKTIKNIYSIIRWTPTEGAFFSGDDASDIKGDQSLFGYDFPLDNEREIDYSKFQLNGATSLDEIPTDAVVYVYAKGGNGDITRVDVSTETVSGVVTKVSSDGTEKTINGKKYKKSSVFDSAANNNCITWGEVVADSDKEFKFYLDYMGKVFAAEKVSGSSEYAVVINVADAEGTAMNQAKAQIKMITADGSKKTYELNTDDIVTNSAINKDSGKWAWGSSVTSAALVKYTLDSDGKIEDFKANGCSGVNYVTVVTGDGKDISKNGYFDGKKISSDAVIYTYDAKSTKADDYSVTKLDAILDSENVECAYIYNNDNIIVAMVIDSSATSDNDVYGVAYEKAVNGSDAGYEITFFINGAKETYNTKSASYSSVNVTSGAGAYKLTFDAAGNVSIAPAAATRVTSAAVTTTKASISGYVITDELGKMYTVDSSAKVYTWDADEDEWAIGKLNDAKQTTGGSIKLIDTTKDEDGVYDIVMIVK